MLRLKAVIYPVGINCDREEPTKQSMVSAFDMEFN